MMFDIALVCLTVGVNVVLAALVYSRHRKASFSLAFITACLCIAVWALSNFFTDHSSDLGISMIAAHIATAAGSNTLFWLAVFIISFVRTSVFSDVKIKAGLVLIWLIVTIFSFSQWVITGVARRSDEGVDLLVGDGYIGYILLLVGLSFVIFYLLVRYIRQSHTPLKNQLRLVLLGVTLSIVGGFLTNGILPVLLNDWQISKLGPALTIFFTTAIAYSMVRYRLFDIRLVIARSVAYLMVLTVMGGIYSIIVFSVVNQFFVDSTIGLTQQLVYMAVAMVLAFTFQPLKNFFDKVTDRIFYRDRYDVEGLVGEITSMAAGTLDLASLSERTLQTLTEGLRVERAGLWVVDEDDFYCSASHNLSDDDLDMVDEADLLDMAGCAEGEILVAESGGKITRTLRRLKMEMAVPLLAGDELQGLLVLGEKQSGEVYTDQDMKALKILGPSLAISLENAQSYQQIREFNHTLEAEVDRATKNLTVANEKLSRSNAKLRQLDTLKDEFISITSHELRTPLTAIRGYLWMALHGKARDDKMQEVYMERAYTSTERLIALVNDSLDISRLDSGRVVLKPAPTDLFQLAKEVAEDLLPKAEQQGQSLVIRKPTRLAVAMADPEKLYQVMTNLVGNALKFTPPGGKIAVSFAVEADKVKVSVADSGPGISDEDKKRLFQKFSRLDAAATTPGTGLGLFLCKEIIRLSKGRIWVESREGHGATFIFELPATKEKVVKEQRGMRVGRMMVGV